MRDGQEVERCAGGGEVGKARQISSHPKMPLSIYRNIYKGYLNEYQDEYVAIPVDHDLMILFSHACHM